MFSAPKACGIRAFCTTLISNNTNGTTMTGIYLYLLILMIIFVFLLVKVMAKRKRDKQAYEEREDTVFYDAAKRIRRD